MFGAGDDWDVMNKFVHFAVYGVDGMVEITLTRMEVFTPPLYSI